MKGAVGAVFVVTLLAVGGTLALSGAFAGPHDQSRNPLAALASAGATNPATALRFTMVLNVSDVRQGAVLGVTMSLLNTLGRANNVTGAEDWELTDASENGGVGGWNCAQNDVFRIEVVQGNYGMDNYSGGRPLDVFLWQPPFGFNQCLLFVKPANWTAPVLTVMPAEQDYYIFRPTSTAAWWVTGAELDAPCLPANGTDHPCGRPGQDAVMNETLMLRTGLFSNSTGVFTVIGGDEWGDIEVLHFRVGPTTGQTTSLSETCTPAMTLTQNSSTTTSTQVITLCHKQSTVTGVNSSA